MLLQREVLGKQSLNTEQIDSLRKLCGSIADWGDKQQILPVKKGLPVNVPSVHDKGKSVATKLPEHSAPSIDKQIVLVPVNLENTSSSTILVLKNADQHKLYAHERLSVQSRELCQHQPGIRSKGLLSFDFSGMTAFKSIHENDDAAAITLSLYTSHLSFTLMVCCTTGQNVSFLDQ